VQAKDPDFAALVRASFQRQGVMGLIGASLGRLEAGHVEIEVPYRPDLSQQHGYFHAGIVTTAMDSAGGYAGLSLMPRGSSVLSVEFKVNLLAPADGERLRARGRVLRAGRTLTVCAMDADVLKAGVWTACATGLQTLMCLPAQAEGRTAG
jgi:uncharacterized protein (TIGR00369 family)